MVVDGETGYLITPGDSQALAQALCKLLADPSHCQALGQRAYERAVDLYTWSRTGQRIRARIMRALAERVPDKSRSLGSDCLPVVTPVLGASPAQMRQT